MKVFLLFSLALTLLSSTVTTTTTTTAAPTTMTTTTIKTNEALTVATIERNETDNDTVTDDNNDDDDYAPVPIVSPDVFDSILKLLLVKIDNSKNSGSSDDESDDKLKHLCSDDNDLCKRTVELGNKLLSGLKERNETNNKSSSYDFVYVLIVIIVVLKFIVMGLSSLIVNRYCKKRRQRQLQQQQDQQDSNELVDIVDAALLTDSEKSHMKTSKIVTETPFKRAPFERLNDKIVI
jgi:flagellar biosynthesis/type III secretory pathway M-ring protein FliF/YscJ